MVRLLVFVSICLVHASSSGQTFGLHHREKSVTKTMFGLQVRVATRDEAHDSTPLVSTAKPVAVPSLVQNKVVTVTRVRGVQVSSGQCPGGVCPTPQRSQSRRFFRR